MPGGLTTWRHIFKVKAKLSTIDERGAAMSLATRSRILSAGLAALAIGVVAACSGPATPAGTGTGAGTSSGPGVDTLVIANAVKVDTLDPEANSVNESIWLDQNLYSRLLPPNAHATGLLPDLATSWTI